MEPLLRSVRDSSTPPGPGVRTSGWGGDPFCPSSSVVQGFPILSPDEEGPGPVYKTPGRTTPFPGLGTEYWGSGCLEPVPAQNFEEQV